MRKKICLNGEWSFMPIYEETIGQDGLWEDEKIRIPSSFKWIMNKASEYQPFDMFKYPLNWDKAKSGIISRDVYIEAGADERVFLIFEGVLQKWRLFVNDKLTLESTESFITTEIDITDYVLNNNYNNIKVSCEPYETIGYQGEDKKISPNGSWFGNAAMGIWQDVFLEYRNKNFIEDVYIKTSTRNKNIELEVYFKNNGDSFEGTLIAEIFNGEVKVKSLNSHFFKDEFKNEKIDFKANWEKSEEWSPHNPKLYNIVITLEADGKVLDQVCRTFGFREFWIDGKDFILNGKKINLRGDAWHYQGFSMQTKEYAYNYYKMCRENGINFVRLHAMPYPQFYLDAADEVGMLVVDESAIYGSHKNMQADLPIYIDNCEKHLKAFVKRDRNHPSVIIWSMQNEMRWVDGREGYKFAMKKLIAVMKAMDETRPISFDGDNRLVDYDDMEIVSMHYNIDGTIASWNKEKPLAFGEHGKWHYISPQVCSGVGGDETYISFDKCMEALGVEEALFNEYARKEEVSALCPFNTSNYMVRSMPSVDRELVWGNLEGEGVKPRVIKAHSLTINNGLLKDYDTYYPNPSLKYINRSFRPVVIVPLEYNKSFYGGSKVERSYIVYNDTEKKVSSVLSIELIEDGNRVVKKFIREFTQFPGENHTEKFDINIDVVSSVKIITLRAILAHDNMIVDTLEAHCKVYPTISKLYSEDKYIVFVGDKEGYEAVSKIINCTYTSEINNEKIENANIIIIGKNYKRKIEELQPILNKFVSIGGFVIFLEQNNAVPGDLTLSGKRFYKTFINIPQHPIFKDIQNEDLEYWDKLNPHEGNCSYIIEDAFNKPVNGDFKILLQCGEGDFGWGGLNFTPMLEYSLGTGRIVLNQLNIIENLGRIPQAEVILKNMVSYGLNYKCSLKKSSVLITKKNSKAENFFKAIGVEYTLLEGTNRARDISFLNNSLVILDLANAPIEQLDVMKNYLLSGGCGLILPFSKDEAKMLSGFLACEVSLAPSMQYALRVNSSEYSEGINNYDLYGFEKVTYSPAAKSNTVLCKNSIEIDGISPIMESVNTPWLDYYIKGFDSEYMKIAISDMVEKKAFKAETFSGIKTIGKGKVIFSQLELETTDKIKRIYTRLLANLGVVVKTEILSYTKKELDFGIPYFMALPYDERNDFLQEENYFKDENYCLNNLGEGVYGWMKRVEKENGYITIPDSAGKTYFLSLFVQSEINRDPEKRKTGELPDSSIVPDLYITINCSFKLYVNGKLFASVAKAGEEEQLNLKVEDVVLIKGINRVFLICHGNNENYQFNLTFKNKYGDNLEGIKYMLTLD